MRISRRDFLKYCSIAAGALGLTGTDLLKLENALGVNGALPVVWLNGQACTGCTVSLANSIYYTTVQDLLVSGTIAGIDLRCMETLSGYMGDQFLPALSAIPAGPLSGAFVLAVEGAIPTANHNYCEIANTITGATIASPVTIYDAVNYYGSSSNCAAILSIGTCASYGGIPGAKGGVTGAKGVADALPALASKVVNIPGCPPNPDWIVGTIATVLADPTTFLATLASNPRSIVDNIGRPKQFWKGRQCTNCYRFDSARDFTSIPGHPNRKGRFVGAKRDYNEIGDPTMATWCLRRIGCKGPKTQSDCSSRQWHSNAPGHVGVNWCVGAGAPCQGCTQKDFPDHEGPFLDIL